MGIKFREYPISRAKGNIASDFDVVGRDLVYIVGNLKDELNLLAGKNLLITGGAGFLGYYLIKTILYWDSISGREKAIHVTVYDNFTLGIPGWLKNLDKSDNFELVKHNISKSLPKNMKDFQFIMHAASIASPTYYRKYPIETMDAIVNGLRLLLEHCRIQKEHKKAVEGFLFFSSSEIYGDPAAGGTPTPETYRGNVSCTGPRACYDEAKRYGETLSANFAKVYGLPIKIVRPFNNYGPGMKITDRRVIADFVRDILAERDIVMLSDGSPTRTFCYVADAVVGYYKALVRGRDGEAYNIGTDSIECSIEELTSRLVELAHDILGYKGKVIHKISEDKDYLVDNPNRRCPNIGKARKELGYNPTISLDEGLRRTLIWYSKNREGWVIE